jgi:hypothetical protein
MKQIRLSLDAVQVIDQHKETKPESSSRDDLYCNVLAVMVAGDHGAVPAAMYSGSTEGEVIKNIGEGRAGDALTVAPDVGVLSIAVDETNTLAVLFLVVLWANKGFSNEQAQFVYGALRDAFGAEINDRSLVELVQLGNDESKEKFTAAIKGRVQGPAILNALKTLNLGALSPDVMLGAVAKTYSAGDFIEAGEKEWIETLVYEGSGGRDGAATYRLSGRMIVS